MTETSELALEGSEHEFDLAPFIRAAMACLYADMHDDDETPEHIREALLPDSIQGLDWWDYVEGEPEPGGLRAKISKWVLAWPGGGAWWLGLRLCVRIPGN